MNLKNTEQLFQQALQYHQKGQLNEALKVYNQILKINPKHFDALQLTATLFLQCKNYSESLHFFRSALKIKSNFVPALINYGNVLLELEDFDEALKNYDKAIRLEPNNPGAYNNRGNILKDLNRFEEALNNYDIAIQLKPDFTEAHNNRGSLLNKLKRYEEAKMSLKKAISLNPQNAQAFYNLGNAIHEINDFNEALENYDKAISLKPDYAEAFNNRGSLFNDIKKFDEALENYDKAISLKPDYAEAISNKAYLKLLLGEYEEGWQLHEFRKNKINTKNNYPKFSAPIWLGNLSIQGKSILVHSEQGLGDTIQFSRYLTMLKLLKPKNIFFHVEKTLIPIMSCFKEDITIIAKDKPLPSFDYYCPLMSLPLAFKTTINNIPNHVPYLKIDINKNKYWQNRLGEKTKIRIGLVWSGSAHHKNDHNRSLILKQLDLILKLPFEFHSLQKDIREIDIDTFKEYKNFFQHQDELEDFSDTAALLNHMDLIISVDTSVAHLAGALGKKVWILLPYLPDFRWLLDCDNSPWYPTAEVFRQPKVGDWESVIMKLFTELNNKFN